MRRLASGDRGAARPRLRGVLLALLAAMVAEAAFAEGDAEEIFARAMDRYRGGDFNAAAAGFIRAAAARPAYFEAHYFAGKSLLKGFPTDLEGADAQFREAVRLRPDSLDAWIALAQNDYEWGRYDRAITSLAEVLRRNPEHRGALYYSGLIEARRGRHDEALRLLMEALRVDPRYAAARIESGLALAHLGRDAEALEAFESVLSADPSNEKALLGAGTALSRMGRKEESRALLTRFREAASAREQSEWRQARIKLWLQEAEKETKSGRFPAALEALRRLLEEYPGDPLALVSRGYVLEKSGAAGEAAAAYEAVLRVEPENLTAHARLSVLYAKLGAPEKAAAARARYEELRRTTARDRD